MPQGIDGIDHVVILVKDLAASRERYARLGFQATPRGTHSPHMGTGNHLFILERDYVELLGVLQPTPNNADWRAKLEQGEGEGLSGMALSTQDATQAQATLQARGLAPLAPLEFSRPVELPEGIRDAAFSVVRLPGDSVPGLGLFVCGHKTRELVWRPEWQRHPNTAHAILSVTLPVDDLAGAAEAWERPFGPGAATRAGAAVTIRTGGHAVLRLVRRDAFGTLFPTLPTLPAGAITFGVRDPAATRAVLQRHGVPHVSDGDTVLVAPAEASGVLVAFAKA